MSENTLVTSLGKQRLAGFVMKIKKKKFGQLDNSSNNINSDFFFPANSSRIFKETQKLFSWQKPNLTAGRGRRPAPSQQLQIARGVRGGELDPSSAHREQLVKWTVSALFHHLLPRHLHFMYPSPPLRRLFCCWKVPSCVWQLPVAMLSAKAVGNPLVNSGGRI